MTIDLNFFNKFFIDYQQRFVHFACTYVHDEAVAEDFVIESMMYYWENKDRLPACRYQYSGLWTDHYQT